jgi:hypothetical protein
LVRRGHSSSISGTSQTRSAGGVELSAASASVSATATPAAARADGIASVSAGTTSAVIGGGASSSSGCGSSAGGGVDGVPRPGDPLYDRPVSDAWHSEFYDPPTGPVRRRNARPLPLRTAATAFFLLFIGVLFGIIGLVTVFTKTLSDAIPFLVISGIGFIPGSYHVVIIVRAWLGHNGYDYSQVPSYD